MSTKPAVYDQELFKFRFDNGSETTATWMADININPTNKPNIIFRLRFLIQQTLASANAELSWNFKLKYSLNGAAYIDTGAQGSTSIIQYANSPNITDNEVTTQQLGAGTFVAGAVDENGDTGTIVFAAAGISESEIEFVLILNGAQFTDNSTLNIRAYKTSDVALNTYTTTPIITRTSRKILLG